jgi:hypothetical protein
MASTPCPRPRGPPQAASDRASSWALAQRLPRILHGGGGRDPATAWCASTATCCSTPVRLLTVSGSSTFYNAAHLSGQAPWPVQRIMQALHVAGELEPSGGTPSPQPLVSAAGLAPTRDLRSRTWSRLSDRPGLPAHAPVGAVGEPVARGSRRSAQRGHLRRWAAYEEIGDYSYSEYLYGFVLPYYRDRLGLVASADDLVRENDLHAIETPLRGNPKLRVFANPERLPHQRRGHRLAHGAGGPRAGRLLSDRRPPRQPAPTRGQRAIMDSLSDLLPPSSAAR